MQGNAAEKMIPALSSLYPGPWAERMNTRPDEEEGCTENSTTVLNGTESQVNHKTPEIHSRWYEQANSQHHYIRSLHHHPSCRYPRHIVHFRLIW